MTMEELIDFIYGTTPDMPHCGHCGRPLLLVKDGNKKYLWCKHCEDLRKEEGEN